MKKRFWSSIALAALIAISSSSKAWSHAEVFSEYSFDQAKQQAQKENKLLLIDCTASWCPPCKMMEKNTWTDTSIQKWIKENAIAIQVDVDRDEKTSRALHIEAMPSMVLFKPQDTNTEFGRQVGYMDPSELLRWLDGIKSGRSAQDIAKEEDNSSGNDVFEHVSKARDLQSAGNNAEALEEYLWLWKNVPESNQNIGPLRTTLVSMEMRKLALAYPPAKTKCVELRDAADKDGNRHDWIILNGILDDNARTLAWFDQVKSDPKQRATIQKDSSFLETILYSKGRWNDVATVLYPDPIAKINDYFKRAQDLKKPRPHTEVAEDFDAFPGMVMTLYGAFVGAGRDADAQKIANECLRLDNTDAMRDSLNQMESGMKKARAEMANYAAQRKTQSKPAK